jgi:hypothetical protein
VTLRIRSVRPDRGPAGRRTSPGSVLGDEFAVGRNSRRFTTILRLPAVVVASLHARFRHHCDSSAGEAREAAAPGGAVAAKSLLPKHQLLIANRSRRRAPNLTTVDRIAIGLTTLSYLQIRADPVPGLLQRQPGSSLARRCPALTVRRSPLPCPGCARSLRLVAKLSWAFPDPGRGQNSYSPPTPSNSLSHAVLVTLSHHIKLQSSPLHNSITTCVRHP